MIIGVKIRVGVRVGVRVRVRVRMKIGIGIKEHVEYVWISEVVVTWL